MMSEAEKKFSSLRPFDRGIIGRALLGLAVLFFLIGHCQSIRAQVPTITDVNPNTVPPDGILKLTFSANLTPRSVKIGNLDASVVSSNTAAKTIEVKVPANIALGPQPVNVFLDETRFITTAITLATVPARIIEVKPDIAQPGGTLFLTFNKQLKPSSVKIGNVDAGFVTELTHRLEVVLPTGIALGRQTIEVRIASEIEPIESSVMVGPRILGLKSNKNAQLQLSRVVVAGGEVIVQFSDKLPLSVKQSLKLRLVDTTQASKSELDPYRNTVYRHQEVLLSSVPRSG